MLTVDMQSVALLIGFLQIHIWQSVLAVPLLTVAPAASHYALGQSVTLTCSLSASRTVDGFIFIKDGTALGTLQDLGQRSRSYLLTLGSVTDSGRYSCKYWKKSPDRRIFTFPESKAVWIHVRAPLQPPSLSSDLQEHLPAEQVTLHCSAPRGAQAKQFQFFYRKEDQISERVPDLNGGARLTLTGASTGEYSCRYLDKENSFSKSSRPIWISLIDPPPRPALKVDPPSGEVSKGDRLLITCLANRSSTEKNFHFYKDGIEIASTHEGFVWSSRESGATSPDASVSIPQAMFSHTGRFACRYEEKLSSRWVTSACSQNVNITVGAPNPSTPLGFYAVLAVLILIAPLTYYCRRWGQASKRQQELEPTETNEEVDSNCLGTLEPRAVALQEEKGSGVTYAALGFCSAGAPGKPTMVNGLEPEEDEGVLYSKIRFQPTYSAANKTVE